MNGSFYYAYYFPNLFHLIKIKAIDESIKYWKEMSITIIND